jgi:signal transduction histidine kinase
LKQDRICIKNQYLIGEEETSKVIYEFNQTEVIYDSKPSRIIILNDITELLNAEYTKTVAKISDIMIASTSHDMRTPINTIINMITLMEGEEIN